MSRLDYSKWDHIEISDDEDDTHPNVDTPSLFKWRHQARLERMEEARKEKEKFSQEKQTHQQRMAEIRQKLKEAQAIESATDVMSQLKLELSELEKQEAEFRAKEEELKRKERLTPLNVDTICKEGKTKTIINKYEPKEPEEISEDEKAERQVKFNKDNEKLMKKFGMFKRYEDSEEFLKEHPHLVCEETANFLVIWCINLQVEEKTDLMNHVAHQTIVMQFILELAKTMKIDPKNCISPFFSRIKLAEKQYTDAFNDELNSFKERIRARAQARIEEAMKEVEEEEKQKRLGPGGEDPVEVFESLPPELQQCFESKDIGMLEKVLTSMPKEQAEYHLKRCIDSGLWVPNAKEQEAKEQEAAGQ